MIKHTFLVCFVGLLLASHVSAQEDFLLVRDSFGEAGQTITGPLEIVLANRNELRGLQFELEYDHTVFSIDAISGINRLAEFDVRSNETSAGRLTFLVTDLGGSAIAPGSEPVIAIDGTVMPQTTSQASPLKLRNIIFSDSQGSTLATAGSDGYVFVSGQNFLRVNNGHQQVQGDTIAIQLYSEAAVGALQFALSYRHEYIFLHSLQKTTRSEAMDLQTNTVRPGEVIILLTSTSGQTIAAGTDALLRFVVDSVATAPSRPISSLRISIENPVLSDTDGQVVAHEAFDGTFLLRIAPAPVSVRDSFVPQGYSLAQNYPNPFNPETIIRYQLPIESEVKLSIYNVLGHKIRTLAKEKKNAGFYDVTWDGRDHAGIQVATGVYVYRMQAGDFVEVKKLMLLR
ncbi:MAG: T9SS type A sorting domain-containing protein [Verrucomicrobia bacterium]|nr:T9SS type A sorting domain-containing protein [Verrucomicrobiota bacterium]